MKAPVSGAFRSLRSFNYRVWAIGSLVSNIGTWIQRTAQDWLVLTQLTHHDASAVGIVMSLQFGPQMLMLPFSGFAADYFDRRKLLFATQASLGALALVLGALTVSGVVRLWHVYALALLLGCVTAFGRSASPPGPTRRSAAPAHRTPPSSRAGTRTHRLARAAPGR